MPAPAVDPRARRSKQALEAALLELVASRDLAQLSVGDLTKRAGVSRSTFYEHYSDVHDLAVAACTGIIDDLVSGSPMTDPNLTASDPLEGNPMLPVFRHVAANAPLYRSLLGPDGSARVIHHLLRRVRIRAHVNRRLGDDLAGATDPHDVPYDPDAALIAGAVVGTVVEWLGHGCPGTPEELAAAVWPQLLGAAAVHGWERSSRPAADP